MIKKATVQFDGVYEVRPVGEWVAEPHMGPRFGKGINPGGRVTYTRFRREWPDGIPEDEARQAVAELVTAVGEAPSRNGVSFEG